MGTSPLLSTARELAAAGEFGRAQEAFERLLAAEPGHPEASTFLSSWALRGGRGDEALALLQTALAQHPRHANLLKNLGVTQEKLGDLSGALLSLQSAVEIDPGHYVARLYLAGVLEKLGRQYESLVAYFRAIANAQIAGQWLDESSTPRWLLSKVRHAMRVAYEGRRTLFGRCLQPLRDRYGTSALQRVEAWLRSFVDAQPCQSPDPRQRPKFMYFPGLQDRPFYPRELFPFIEELENATAQVRQELLAHMDIAQGFEPFLGSLDEEQVGDYLSGTGGKPQWEAFFFYRHGRRYTENASRCASTAALLERLPLVRIRDHAPEICFSLLTAGTHILPHHGVTNTRLVLHLPLIVPPDCALVVGGETHVWREGECVVFDDTYLHEAWNGSDRLRAVLIMDVWNPYLSEAEREAITVLVEAIGDFNRAAGF